MKKIAIISLLVLVALSAFAQETKINVYGSFRFDHDLSKADLDGDTTNEYGKLNIARARVGGKWTLSDTLMAKTEVNVDGGELRLAHIEWDATEDLKVIFGREWGVFAPESFDGSGIYDLVGLEYTSGIVTVEFQVGDAKDDNGPLYIMPALTVTPDLGDLSLTVGVGAQYKTAHKTETKIEYVDVVAKEVKSIDTEADVDAVTDLNAYFVLGVSDLEVIASAEYESVQEDATLGINTNLNYSVNDFNVGTTATIKNIVNDADDSDATTDLTFFVKRNIGDATQLYFETALDNVTEANDGELDYSTTLRFSWFPKYDF